MGSLSMGSLEDLAGEPLRRLDRAQVGAVDRSEDSAVGDPLHRVDDRQHRHHRLRAGAQGRDDVLEDRSGRQGSSRVVDQDEVDGCGQGRQPEADRLLPFGAARSDHDVVRRQQHGQVVDEPHGHNDDHRSDRGHSPDTAHGVQQQGLTGQLAQRLDHSGAHPLTAAGGRQHDSDAHPLSRSRVRPD